MPTDSYRVIGVRADGSRLTLWSGDSRQRAEHAAKSMSRAAGYSGGCYVELDGKRSALQFPYRKPD